MTHIPSNSTLDHQYLSAYEQLVPFFILTQEKDLHQHGRSCLTSFSLELLLKINLKNIRKRSVKIFLGSNDMKSGKKSKTWSPKSYEIPPFIMPKKLSDSKSFH